jgi:hypothetical protein
VQSIFLALLSNGKDMKSKKVIAGGLVASLIGGSAGMCEVVNAAGAYDEEWTCKPEHHIPENTDNQSANGPRTSVQVNVTPTGCGSLQVPNFMAWPQ